MNRDDSKWRDLWGSEWEYVKKLGLAIHDPAEKRHFWKTIKKHKETNPHFSIYDLYPRSTSSKLRSMEECVSFVKNLRKPKREDV